MSVSCGPKTRAAVFRLIEELHRAGISIHLVKTKDANGDHADLEFDIPFHCALTIQEFKEKRARCMVMRRHIIEIIERGW